MPQKSRKTLEHLRLTDSIAKFGFDIMPYSFYKGKGFRCKIIERSSRYAEYTRRGHSYNTLVPHLGREADHLEQAEETIEMQLLRAQ
ncbi:uncharacterized protein FTOL_13825 [Fusarium torulosum]|uniref:Uncharacterized protein n=1 Tax=Fusarium torulosum TaxID=33205 RepID=A0AAE8MQ40_9HYPO|nr:uncharacterized protein FTOL_13825 [Fusarium torulosum]